MAGSLSGRAAIAGVGETLVGKSPDSTVMGLHLQAVKAALDDAGLAPGDVDGIVTMEPSRDAHRSFANRLAQAAGFDVHFAADVGLGGAGPAVMAQVAAQAIASGLCRTVLCAHGGKNATGHLTPSRGNPVRDGREDWEEPYGVARAIPQYASIAARHMYEFGTTSEQMAAVAVAMRKHASLNATATMRKPITVDDVMSARWIVKPLHLLDCCLVSDGAAAFVVTSAEQARDLPKPPAYLLGFGQHHPHFALTDAPSLTTLGSKQSGEAAYRMAGLGPADMDFAQIYDCFTPVVIITLEDYGFCAKGEGGAFVEGGRIEIGGQLPVNTHGGLLSHAHTEGMAHIIEAVRQIRGGEVEPERQIGGARVGIVSGNGGIGSTHGTLIIGRDQVN
jgi:acetyl-CoA acetyltransferase